MNEENGLKDLRDRVDAHDKILWRKRNGRDGGLVPIVANLEDFIAEVRGLVHRIWWAVLTGVGGILVNLILNYLSVKN